MNDVAASRRDFVRSCVLFTGAAAVSSAQPRRFLLRKDLLTLTAKSPELVAFAEAREAMRRLPAGDPHHWDAWANIHGVPSGVPVPPAARGVWDTCEHGSWWFLPWHRAYLVFLERLVRHYSGDRTFALPYWRWEGEAPANRALHPIFLDGGSLFIPQRSRAANSGVEFLNPARIRAGLMQAMRATRFEGVGGRPGFGGPRRLNATHEARPHGLLEAAPHDYIHAAVGGAAGFMRRPELSARDPVFWVHHANVDRLWVEWRAAGGEEPSDDRWFDRGFTFFNEDRQRETVRVRDLLKMNTLGYGYDTAPEDRRREVAARPVKDIVALAESRRGLRDLNDLPQTVILPLGPDAVAALRAIAAGGESAYAALTLHGVRFRGEPDSSVDAYLNLPEGARPTPTSIHYAGTFSFFGREPGRVGIESEVEITTALQALAKARELRGTELRVTLVRFPSEGRGEMRGRLLFEQLSLAGID